MSKGRPRKSPQEKLLEGSRAKIQVEVFAPHGAPFVPEHLNDDAQACAEHIIRSFSTKHISGLDSYCLAVFAAAWAWHKAAFMRCRHRVSRWTWLTALLACRARVFRSRRADELRHKSDSGISSSWRLRRPCP
jgi:hypothetical protein